MTNGLQIVASVGFDGTDFKGPKRGCMILRPAFLASFAMALAASAPAYATLIISPTFDSTITSDPNAAAIEGTINSAIAFFQSTFTDPINVSIQFAEMSSGLGQSTTGFYNVSYSTYLAALKADATSSDDATANSFLPNSSTNPVNSSSTINVKSANLRAVGMSGAPRVAGCGGFCDGFIDLNTHITDVGSPGTSGQFSLFATVEHEIDEVLGLNSSLASTPFGTIFPEDLFRYDAVGNRNFTTNAQARAFLSINSTTDLAQFDNQNDGGDFGDWQSNPLPSGVLPRVQDAFATAGAHPTLVASSPELVALDVIGYDRANTVPEPATALLIGAGLVAIGGLIRRRAGRRG
jgi:hypothetical protein